MKKLFTILSGEGEPNPETIEAQAPVVEFTPAAQMEVTPQAAAMLDLIESNPSILDTDQEVKAWYEQHQAIFGGGEPAEQKPAEKKPADKKPEEQKPAEQKPVEEKKNPWRKKSTETDFASVTFDDLPKVVSEKFGIDTTKENWLSSFLTSFEKQRAIASQTSNISSEVEKTKAFIANLPQEIKVAIKAHSEGEDWKSVVLSDNSFSYDKKFEELTVEEKSSFINKVMKKEVKAEDLSKEESASLIESAKDRYEINKEKSELAKTKALEDKKAKIEKRANEAEKSVLLLKQSIPDLDEDAINEVKEVITAKGISSLFIGEDNELLPDVAERVAFVLYGRNLLEEFSAISSAKGANQERQEIIERNISRQPERRGVQNNNFKNKEEESVMNERKIAFTASNDPYA